MDVLHIGASEEVALRAVSPCLRQWFLTELGSLTAIQRLAWPVIAQKKSLLLSAPTGTGKTLAAMVPVLSKLLDQPVFAPSVRCLYLSPLKALTHDLDRSLTGHFQTLRSYVPRDTPFPTLATRTGDTGPTERRLLWEEPPDILMTTPESLAVLLSHCGAGTLFSQLEWLIVDEIHALAGNKRGADLSLSLERLQQCSEREIQRIGLSATSTPLTETASFLVGTDRSCTIAQTEESSPLELSLIPLHQQPAFVQRVIDHLVPELCGENAARSILIFANTRSLAERLSWSLRRRMPQWNDQIAVHHSALAAERRRDVESRFKQGQLRVIVSSTSLELGIDIGTVDLVALAHPPGGVIRLLQRIGRAGHAPGLLKRGIIFTATPGELLEAAVTAAAGQDRQCEHLQVANQPWDVLCQQLLGMATAAPWDADETFDLVRRAYPYRKLSREDFDACLAYLCGRCTLTDEETWVPPRLRPTPRGYELVDDKTRRVVRRNLGTILTEDACNVMTEVPSPLGEGTDVMLIGQVDETFADRLNPGDLFLLDGRCLEFARLEQQTTAAQVFVREVIGRPGTPRWAGEGVPMSSALAQRLFVLRAQAAEAVREGTAALCDLLRSEYHLSGQALQDLLDYFDQQEQVSEIPMPDLLLVEAVPNVMGGDYYLHTSLNRAGNDAIARVVSRRLERQGRGAISTVIADLGLALLVRDRGEALTPDEIRQALSPDGFEEELTESLVNGLVFRNHFQRVATTGLMILRNPIGNRRRVGGRDWGERQLFDQVREENPNFILLRQAEREVREDTCDSQAAFLYLQQLPARTIRCRWLSQPSPFVEGWTHAGPGVEPSLSTEDALQRLYATLMGDET